MSGFTPYMAAAWKAGVEEGRPTDIAWRTKRRPARSRAMLGMRPATSAASKTSRERPSICTTRRRRRAVASAEPSLVQRAIRSTVPWSLRTRSSIMMRAASPGRSRARVYRASRAFGPPLHLAAYGDRDHLEEAADDTPILPALVRHLLGAGQVVDEHALQALGDALVVDDQVDLVVEPEGALVEVGASHRCPLAVDHHGLGVEERRAVLVDLDSGEETTAQLRAASLAHQVVVDRPREEEPHPDTTACRLHQCVDHLLVGKEVRVGDVDGALGRVHGEEVHGVHGGAAAGRRAPYHLGGDSTLGLDRGREVVGASQRDPRGLKPVLREGALELLHHRSLDPKVGVAPVVGLSSVAAPLPARA